MAGTVLTGITSLLLMGGALHAALDGRQELALAPSALGGNAMARDASPERKVDRPHGLVAVQPVSERILQVPTLTRQADGNVIRKRPFAYATAPLAVDVPGLPSYPSFDPLNVFRSARDDGTALGRSDLIYAADVESEVRLVEEPFPLTGARFASGQAIAAGDAEAAVRAVRDRLGEDDPQVALTAYMDATRFSLDEDAVPASAIGISIVAQNVSAVPPASLPGQMRESGEEVIALARPQSLKAALSSMQLSADPLARMVETLRGEGVKVDALPAGTRLRAAWERDGAGEGERLPRRLSLYRDGRHLLSVALADSGQVVAATPPPPVPAVLARSQETERQRTLSGADLPTVWDGIHRAALSQGLTKDHARRIARTVAFDVDFRGKVKPRDHLEVFYSLAEGAEQPSAQSEILYIGLSMGGRERSYYRFRPKADGPVGYYDAEGRSGRKFLLRQPVPNGKFRSGFGMRRHPITRRQKMHQGVDFSAPRGTPILAAGDGVIDKIGWAGGYGRQLILRHANGYKTSYNHMHRFARGMKKGSRVRQGQVIGSVGSTGFSTGPHLHYEMLVNGARVNPMKIRLPQGDALKGKALREFQRERARIDALIRRGRRADTTVASL